MNNRPNLILVVDDEVEMERLLRQRFRRKIQAGELNFKFAQNGVEALQILQNANHDIAMVLTDIRMPQMDGLTLLANLADLELPLKAVVISAYGDMRNIRTAMNRGAFDFLTKPIDFEDLELTINKTLKSVHRSREQQQELQQALDKLHNLVFYDQLTELLNHQGLLQQCTQLLEEQQNHSQDFALLMLDIERHSIIKSGFGHALGNQLVVEFAQRLEQITDASTSLARVGENIFAILWHSLDSLDDFHDKVASLLRLLECPFQLGEIIVSSTSRMGAALSDIPYTQPETFVQAADTAIQIARQENRKELVFFDIQMQETAIQRLNLEVELQKAIETQQLSLHYQPLLRLDSQRIVGFEALARWDHPTRGAISPLEFIPLAEETGLIVPLGEWVITEACQQLGRWQSQFGSISPTCMSVNLSSPQLQTPNLLNHIDASLRDADLTGEALKLEITESVVMENIDETLKLLTQLRDRNIQLVIDDFGTGYSSLAYLQQLPVNALKIDRSFVIDLDVNPTNFDITSTIINLAHHLNLEVVAEGLEKQEHLEILNSLSCEYGQGFIFSGPLDAKTATQLIANIN
ncbi:putative bifunctional diguanylate cyclase/phosphodiesterase [Leptothoe spongobia]|uniref:EAL domain-containing protein n=1 Tax=Leptothoe spongobia TAU-MAC 1115 TaxID=1967444 RepID=A0A947GKW7_9CYAN|nr:EAL domain-containing protein [Leptothoe spongobia]MBT9317874.1 EAL domain-containing protein [Leptothoe spongobia TAU-MAC 1115]